MGCAYEEELQRLTFASLRVLLAQRDHLLGQPLGLLRFVPCCRDALMLDQGCDQVSEERSSVRRRP